MISLLVVLSMFNTVNTTKDKTNIRIKYNKFKSLFNSKFKPFYFSSSYTSAKSYEPPYPVYSF